MSILESTERYAGRKFQEKDWYTLLDRQVAYRSDNKVWLITVDKICDEDGEELVRISKWAARKQDKNGTEVDIWRNVSGYNVRHEDNWAVVSDQVSNLFSGGFRNAVTVPRDEYNRLQEQAQEVSDLRDTLEKLREFKQSKAGELEEYKERIKEIRKDVEDYQSTLSNFHDLVNEEDTTETQVHDFLDENDAHWIFGLQYKDIEHEVHFPPESSDYRFDSMLLRHDNFHDLVELKGPNENLFDQRTKNRSKPNAKLSEAVGQVFTYLRACEKENLNQLFKPKAIIVIGKDNTDDIEERRLFSSYLSNVEIMTYSDLYQQGEKLISHIQSDSLEGIEAE